MSSVTGTQPTRHTFIVLDALRGLAALAVLMFHYTGELYHYKQVWPPSAWLAVDFFFVLSGFVIAYAYEDRLKNGMSLRSFTIIRLIRLYPLYWLATTVALIATLVAALADQTSPDWASLLPSYLLNAAFLPKPPWIDPANLTFLFNNPAWSLSLEMAVNILFVFIFSKLTTLRLGWLTAAGGLVLVAAFFLNQEDSWNWHQYWGGWGRVVFSFFAGILLYRAFALRKPAFLSPYFTLPLAGFLLAIFLAPRSGSLYPIFVCLIVFPFFVWWGARATLWKPLTGPCIWLGRLSYVIYIMHIPLLKTFLLISKMLGSEAHEYHPRVFAFLFAILTLLICIFLDSFYDLPIRNWLTKKFRARPHAKEVIAP